MPRKEGQWIIEDFLTNTGGLNTADSPFIVGNDQATGGQNFDYIKRGGIQKRAGHLRLNAVADTQLTSLGLGLFDKPTTNRVVVRAAGRKLQDFDFNAYTFSNLSEDTTAATTDLLASGTTVPVAFTMFNTAADTGALWATGGGLTNLVGAYSSTKATKNGVVAPTTSAFTATGSTSGGTLATGYYTYSLAYRKGSTQAISNVMSSTSEPTGNVASGSTGSVALAWTLTNNDTAKYDKIYVYRSSVTSNSAGSAGFTAGVLVAILASSATTYTDTGAFESSSVNVPRAGNTLLDNSQLPSATNGYEAIATFKRRLVTAYNSTLYVSDLNKPESWPLENYITVPSGGKITALAVLSLTSGVTGASVDEVLCIFKERELWVLTGSDADGWALLFIDNSGTQAQRLVVAANGYLAWVNYRGAFMWNGGGKPSYISQPIEDKFAKDGDLDKSQMGLGWGVFSHARNEVQWYLSSLAHGVQKYVLKLDMRLTSQGAEQNLVGRVVKGVFTPDVLNYPLYAGLVFTQSASATEELLYQGDSAGFMYSGYSGTGDSVDSDITMQYDTPYLHFGSPGTRKRYHRVTVWVLNTGTYDLTLNYWAAYRHEVTEAGSRALPVNANLAQDPGIWDTSNWDEADWDSGTDRVRPLSFNLGGTNSEGDSLRLQLAQTGNEQNVIIYGFSVYYTEIGADE